jgi:thiamine pyrophosphokinase
MVKSVFDPFPKFFDALLVGNGLPPSRRLLRMLAGRTFCVIALDGGLEVLFRCGISPEHVVGDLDSAPARALRWAIRNGARVHRRPSADRPDFAKGLDLCRELRCRNLVVLGVTGERTDHVLSSLHFALAARGLSIMMVSNEVVILPLCGHVMRTVSVPREHTLSWFGFPQAELCSLAGVRWPFARRNLSASGFHSLSNAPRRNVVRLEQKSGRSLFIVSLRPQQVNPDKQ